MKKAVFWEVSRLVVVRNEVSEERTVSIIKVENESGELGTLAVTINRSTLRRTIRGDKFFEMSVPRRATRHNITKDCIIMGTSLK
jgi:hypothetical protein